MRLKNSNPFHNEKHYSHILGYVELRKKLWELS